MCKRNVLRRLVADLPWDRCLARPGLGTRLVPLDSAARAVVWLCLACAGGVRPAGPRWPGP